MEALEPKVSMSKILITGMAIFALFFGAGNLIFPPYLGVLTGEKWGIAFIGFAIGDVVFGSLALIATLRELKAPVGIWARVGNKWAIFLGSLFFLFNGALFALPRTCATAFELGVSQVAPGMPSWTWAVIYFLIVWFFAIKPTKVVDYVGKYLTPLLILTIVILVVKGVISPIGTVREEALVTNLFAEGLLQGYLTMDACAGITSAGVVLAAAIGYGYKKEKTIHSFITKSTVIGGIILAILYTGLCYLGVTASTMYGAEVEQTVLLVDIAGMVMGNGGKYILGIIAALACLTTGIGISSATATFFVQATKGKVRYNIWVTIFCIFSACAATIGVAGLVKICTPIINLVYPTLITGIILTLFNRQIKNDNVVKCCSYVSFAMGLLALLKLPFIDKLPLANIGFEWVIPVLIALVISLIITGNKPTPGRIIPNGEAIIENYDQIMNEIMGKKE